MNRSKLALLGAAVVCMVASDAYAESVGAVIIHNDSGRGVAIEYRVGASKDCLANKDFVGTRDIPAGDKWQLTVHNEAIACIRVNAPGKSWWWNKVSYGKVEYYHIH